MSAILHQGDVYTATYAAAPHLVRYAEDLGPGEQSDDLLSSIAYASRGGPGPEIPEFLEEAWDDAQSDARDLILERLVSGLVSEFYASSLISGLLDLDGEWGWAEHVRNWGWGYSIKTQCSRCGKEQDVFWHKGRTRQVGDDNNIQDFEVIPSSAAGVRPDDDLEFDGDQIPRQLIGLAESTGYDIVTKQIRCLFGTFPCASCGQTIEVMPRRE